MSFFKWIGSSSSSNTKSNNQNTPSSLASNNNNNNLNLSNANISDQHHELTQKNGINDMTNSSNNPALHPLLQQHKTVTSSNNNTSTNGNRNNNNLNTSNQTNYNNSNNAKNQNNKLNSNTILFNHKFCGLENFGNTCYANSILQALFGNIPFRKCIQTYQYPESTTKWLTSKSISMLGENLDPKQPPYLSYIVPPHSIPPANPSSTSSTSSPIPPQDLQALSNKNLYWDLRDLFEKMANQRKKISSCGPSEFIVSIRRENELFRGNMHQDAHEFFNFLINSLNQILLVHNKSILTKDGPEILKTHTWINHLFQGTLSNETRCLTCENVTERDETFLDLSVDIDEDFSLSSCLKKFSKSEILSKKDKFYCGSCCSLQEAEKRMMIKRLPNLLAIHLKRFKYKEEYQRHVKLFDRIVFQDELRVEQHEERLYMLISIVVHIGSGPNHGHYIALVKSEDKWALFDDERVEFIDTEELPKYFGDQGTLNTGYFFIFQAQDFDANSFKPF